MLQIADHRPTWIPQWIRNSSWHSIETHGHHIYAKAVNGDLCDSKKSGRPRNAGSEDNINAVIGAFSQSPKKSVRRASDKLNLSKNISPQFERSEDAPIPSSHPSCKNYSMRTWPLVVRFPLRCCRRLKTMTFLTSSCCYSPMRLCFISVVRWADITACSLLVDRQPVAHSRHILNDLHILCVIFLMSLLLVYPLFDVILCLFFDTKMYCPLNFVLCTLYKLCIVLFVIYNIFDT